MGTSDSLDVPSGHRRAHAFGEGKVLVMESCQEWMGQDYHHTYYKAEVRRGEVVLDSFVLYDDTSIDGASYTVHPQRQSVRISYGCGTLYDSAGSGDKRCSITWTWSPKHKTLHLPDGPWITDLKRKLARAEPEPLRELIKTMMEEKNMRAFQREAVVRAVHKQAHADFKRGDRARAKAITQGVLSF